MMVALLFGNPRALVIVAIVLVDLLCVAQIVRMVFGVLRAVVVGA